MLGAMSKRAALGPGSRTHCVLKHPPYGARSFLDHSWMMLMIALADWTACGCAAWSAAMILRRMTMMMLWKAMTVPAYIQHSNWPNLGDLATDDRSQSS